MNDLGAWDEVELPGRENEVFVEGRLEGEVEAPDGFWRVEPGGGQCDADAAAFAEGGFLCEQGVDGVERAGLSALDLPDDVVQRLDGAGIFSPTRLWWILSISTVMFPLPALRAAVRCWRGSPGGASRPVFA